MSDFNQSIAVVLSHETGELVHDDNGRGPSKWGITLLTAREFYPNCSPDDIARMTPQSAAQFYRMAFWDRYHVGLIEDQALATETLDLAVNLGGGAAVKLLQQSAGVADDSVLGPSTTEAVNANPVGALASLKTAAAAHYRELAAKNPALAGDLQGWLNRLGTK